MQLTLYFDKGCQLRLTTDAECGKEFERDVLVTSAFLPLDQQRDTMYAAANLLRL